MNYYAKETSIGQVTITEDKGFITGLYIQKEIKKINGKNILSDILQNAFNQLEEYLCGKRKNFDLPLNPKGTPFMQKVWSYLYQIPYGETRTYKDIAVRLGNEKSYRAVGNANNKNPIPIFIPCHRVIGSDGSLIGYAYGLDVKRKLLELEELNINYNQA